MAINAESLKQYLLSLNTLLKVNQSNSATDSVNPKRTHGSSIGNNNLGTGARQDSKDTLSLYQLVELVAEDLGLGAGGSVQTLAYNTLTYDLSISGGNSVSLATLVGGGNIYDIDGTLIGNRAVGLGGFDLTLDTGNIYFNGIGDFQVSGATNVNLSDVTGNTLLLDEDGISLEFEATKPLFIDGNAGTAGQVPISQGIALPPVWGNVNGIGDTDADTGISTGEDTAAAGGDQILFVVDGNQVGSVEALAGGITKWTLDGILDPTVYRPNAITTTVRDTTFTPIAVEGDLIYNSTESRYELYDGAAWQPLVTGIDDVSYNTVNLVNGNVVPVAEFASTVYEWTVVGAQRSATFIDGIDNAVVYVTNEDASTVQLNLVDGLTGTYTGPSELMPNEVLVAFYIDAQNVNAYKISTEPKARVFFSDTAVAPAIAGAPTAAEIKAQNDSLGTPASETVIYYTGNDTSTDPITYVFHVDGYGNVTLIEEPSSTTIQALTNVAGAVDWDASLGARAIYENGNNNPTAFNAPTNLVDGERYSLIITNTLNEIDIAFDSAFKASNGITLGNRLLESNQELSMSFIAHGGNLYRTSGRPGVGSSLYSTNITTTLDFNISPHFNVVIGGVSGTLDIDDSYYKATGSDEDNRAYLVEFSGFLNPQTVTFSTEFIKDDGTQFGPLAVGTGIPTIVEFFPSANEQKFICRILKSEVEATLVATLLDSSAGADAQVLDAATGSGDTKFFANSDVTSNAATLGVQAGESLNGVTDGTFNFDAYADGTQFVATDTGLGTWVVAVEGASTSTSLAYLMAAITSTFTTTGSNYVVPFDVETIDTDAAYDNATYEFTAPRDGRYEIIANLSYENQSVSSDDTQALSIRKNTVIQNSTAINPENQGDGNNDSEAVVSILDLVAGDIIDIYVSGVSGNIQLITDAQLAIKQLPTTEAVLAGMVTPTEIGSYYGVWSQDDMANGDFVNFNTNLTESTNNGSHGVTFSGGGDILLEAGSTYRIEGAFRTSAAADNDLSIATTFEFRDSGSLKIGVTGKLAAGDAAVKGYYPAVAYVDATAGQQLITFNKVGSGGAAPDYDGYLKIEKVAESTVTVINSSDTVVNDQATSGYVDIGTMRMQWGIDTGAITGDRTITLPVAFANANYTVTASIERASGTGMGVLRSRTTADFVMQSINGSGTGIVDDIHWYAIGLKP